MTPQARRERAEQMARQIVAVVWDMKPEELHPVLNGPIISNIADALLTFAAQEVEQAGAREREFMTRDHPMANGRAPQPGEQEWHFTFPLADGTTLSIRAGKRGRDALVQIAHQEATDDVLTAALRQGAREGAG